MMVSMNMGDGVFPMEVSVTPPDSPETGYRVVFTGVSGIVSVTMPGHLVAELVEAAEAALDGQNSPRATKMAAFIKRDKPLVRRDHGDKVGV